MALTPIDVQQKTFGTALRGYDLDEVDDFLDDVVTSLKGYEQRLAEAQARIQALETELAGKGDSESAISRALVAAQRSADMIIEDANREADRLLTDARTQSEMLAAVREEERAKLQLEVSSMKAGVAEVREKVRSLTASVSSDLDEMERTVATAEAQVTDDEARASSGATTMAAGALVGAVDDDRSELGVDDETVAAAVGGDTVGEAVDEAVDESDSEANVDADIDVGFGGADLWDDQADQATERGSDLDAWVTPQPDDVVESARDLPPSAAFWASALADDEPVVGDDEPVAPHDPLDEALAEATFADLEPTDGPEGDVEAADEDSNAGTLANDDSDEIATADSLQTDDVEAGEAWERAGLEGWGADATPSSDDDRPRRPWE